MRPPQALRAALLVMSFPQSWMLLLFPIAVLFVLALLRMGLYRHLGDPAKCFEASARPPRLRRALSAILVIGGVIYVALVAVRVAILSDLAKKTLQVGAAFPPFLAGAGLLAFILVCELIVVTHLFFYLRLCRDGVRRYRLAVVPEIPGESPKVALLIPACDEPVEVLARPLGSLDHIRYRNCRVILVENSRDPACKREALDLARKHGVEALDIPNRGTKAAALNEATKRLDPDTKYVAVIDADQALRADMVTDLVALLEADPKSAWIQTTQIYQDASTSLLRTAATQQMLMLYDSALQGKDVRGVCPMLGTNFLLRLDVLNDVGGWEERFVGEDTPTSYAIQLAGWKGRYREQVYATGLGPPTIAGLRRQQLRWAHSNSKLAFSIIHGFFRGNRRPRRVVIEYLALTSYELLTFAIALLATVPSIALVTAALLVGSGSVTAPTAHEWQWVFVSLYPFHVLLLFFPHINMGLRGYPLRNLLLMQGLVACLGPVYLEGIRRTLFRERMIFESPIRTYARPDGDAGELRSWRPAPQTLGFLIFLCLGSLAFGIALRTPTSPFPWIVTFWAMFHAVCTGHYVLFLAQERRAVRAASKVAERLPAVTGEVKR